MKDDTVSRASVLKAIDEYERLSAVSQTVRNIDEPAGDGAVLAICTDL